MQAYSARFGGGADQTILHPAVLVAMLLAMVLFFILPRRYVIVPFLVTIFLIPQGQQLYVAGVHLFVNRLLVLVAFVRGVISREPKQRSVYAGGWTSIDTATVSYMVIVAVATTLQYITVPAIVNQVGYLWDYILGYLALRILIRDEKDAILAIQCCAGLTVIFAITMTIEQKSMVNVFGLLGGVAAKPELRDGKIRSQGAFQHALTAGTFAGTAIPLFFLMWKRRATRWLSALGIVGATIMVVVTQTSTSLLTGAAGVLAVFLWPIRKKMKMVRIGLVASLIGLSMVMKAPVWFIIGHIDLTGSSSSYHRAELIDQCINHFSNWWLMGTTTAATWGWDMWDAQNMYVSIAEGGGLAALVFYILAISRSFARLGDARKRANTKQQEWLFWFLGAALFAHVVGFFGVNYFDQARICWFLLISMICATTTPMLSRSARVAPAKVVVRVSVPGELEDADQAIEPKAPMSGSKTGSYPGSGKWLR
jgi:hypothetical protein